MKHILYLGAVAALVAQPSFAAAPIATGHADVGIAYAAGAFDLHVHDGNNDQEYSPSDALLVVRYEALQLSPGGAFGFLGPAGTPNWVLPQNPSEGILFLGIGAEELAPSDWLGEITLSLKGVSGPGNFYLWDTDAFGRPVVKMNSADGISGADQTTVTPGSHSHLNWGFSAVGTYSLSFEASGVNLVDGPQNSGVVSYQFQVVPEPETWVLFLLGAGGLVVAGCRRASGASGPAWKASRRG